MLQFIVCLLAISFWFPLRAYNVGLLIMATGKYDRFVMPLVESADRYFLKDHKITYYIFTDGNFPKRDDLVVIYQKRLGWPFDTMKRYHVYYANRNFFEKEDYLFAIDADMFFRDKIGDEILGDLVAVLHPGFNEQRGSYETNPDSLAYVSSLEGAHYFAGGFYGGKRKQFLKAIKTNIDKIDNDFERGIIAVWHDESHWNRYCIDHPPMVILPSAYCYSRNCITGSPKDRDPRGMKIETIDNKNHDEMRKE